MNRKLPPYLSSRKYKTAGGYKRTLYYVRFTDDNKDPPIRRNFPVGEDFDRAVEECYRLLRLKRQGYDFDKPPEKVLTLHQAIEAFYAVKKDKASLDKDRRSAERLEDFFGAATPLNDVNQTLRIEQYKSVRRSEKTKYGRPPANATINRELSFLLSVLWLHESALEENPKVALLPEDNARARTATEAEFAAICAQLDEDTARLMIAYWETPCRKAEPVLMRWSHVDLENDVINLPPEITKTKKGRQVPISEVLKAALLELKAKKVRGITDHVFTSADGSPITYNQLSWRWKNARKAAAKIVGPGIMSLWFHDLRGTWCTAKVRAGNDRKFVMEISGHKTQHVFERYVRPTLEDLREVVKKK